MGHRESIGKKVHALHENDHGVWSLAPYDVLSTTGYGTTLSQIKIKKLIEVYLCIYMISFKQTKE